METIIALDLMGGDIGAAATVPGAVAALDQFTSLGLVVVGRRADIYPTMIGHGFRQNRRNP